MLHRTAPTTHVEMKCVNRDCCERDVAKELPAFQELGGTFLCDDDDVYCAECGAEMHSALN